MQRHSLVTLAPLEAAAEECGCAARSGCGLLTAADVVVLMVRVPRPRFLRYSAILLVTAHIYGRYRCRGSLLLSPGVA